MTTTRKYAKGTDVTVRQSLAELEDLIERFAGNQPSGFGYATQGRVTTVQFEIRNRRVRLSIHLPDLETYRMVGINQHVRAQRTDAETKAAWQREVNRLWRSLVDVVKAKLVAIDDGITTFEAEFLANLVLPSGDTIGERMAVDLETTLRTGELPPLMPGMPASAKVIAIWGGSR